MSLRGTATKEIATATGVSPRTISRILRLWKTTGQTAKHSLDKGRPRALTSLEVSYLVGLVERRPDIYVSELQQALFVAYDVEVDAKRKTMTRENNKRVQS
ncbi:hypothetical protein BJ912DRAFT_941579 [Pholiota molesta]|nr:hypothetical protein BJ912DRAFT_941579 [Pholiota molesta]